MMLIFHFLLYQEPHFVTATSTLIEGGPTDHPYKSGEEASQIPVDNLAPTTSAQPDEDPNMLTTSSGGTEETKINSTNGGSFNVPPLSHQVHQVL
jgi:hypothetical protein